MIFLMKLILSFLVGGGVIAGLGWLAENADRKIAGVVISLPSTVVLSYFFIGWTASPETVAAGAPATVITAVAIQLFAVAYFYLSKIRVRWKVVSITVSAGGALLVWFVLAIPIALNEFSNLWLAIAGYAVGVAIGYYFITVRNTSEAPLERIHYTNKQHMGRAVFAGSVVTSSVLLANLLSPFWGGVFSSFPAVFTSTFIIMHWYHGHNMIAKVTKKIPTGSLIYIMFPIAAYFTYPAFGLLGGTLAAYGVSLVVFFFHYRWQQRTTFVKTTA